MVRTFTTSNPLTAVVKNTGAAPINSLALTATAGFDLVSNTCGATLAADASCLVELTATPASDGAASGKLSATAAAGLQDEIPLVVAGFTPSSALSLTPKAGLDFGSIQTGAASPSKPATLTNTGGSELTGIELTAGGPFTAGGGSCGATLAPGASCTVQVGFAPATAGPHADSLLVAAAGGLIDSIPLSGQGYVVGASSGFKSIPEAPGPILFGSGKIGSSQNATLNLQEIGASDLVVSKPVLSGPAAADFSLPGSTFPLLIQNGGASRSLTLTCTPSAASARAATLGLTTNDPLVPTLSYNLQCTGRPLVEVSALGLWTLGVLVGLLGLTASVLLRRAAAR
jgi:hypothetical protein